MSWFLPSRKEVDPVGAARMSAQQAQFERWLNAPARPILMALAKRITEYTINRGGVYPPRWCVSKQKMHEFHLETIAYSAATGHLHRELYT